jgi:hypothetical protein
VSSNLRFIALPPNDTMQNVNAWLKSENIITNLNGSS